MATKTFHGVMGSSSSGQWGYYGGSTYAANQWGYVDYTGYGYKTRAKITVAPDSNKKITDITVRVTVRRSGNTNLLAYLCTSENSNAAGATSSAPTSYITTAREVTPNGSANPGSGTQWSFTFHNLSITSSTVYYVWWQTATNISGSLTEILDGHQGSTRGSIDLTQVSLTSSISYNGNGYTGGTLPGSGSYNIGSSYTVSSNTLTHSDTNGYVVSFNSNGGGTAPSAITQKIGWTHDYWTLNGTGGTRYNKGASFTVPSSASTFYAHWATSRRAITLPAAPSAPTGKHFTGWYTASSGGSKAGNAGASWTPDTTRTLYAQWAWNTYTVSYNGNGYTGGTLPGNQTKTYGTNLTLSSNNLTKSNTSLTGFTVTFNKNGGNNPSVASVTNTRSTSYSHNGWRLNGTSGTLYSKGGTYSTNAAATFYASWSTTTNNGQVTTATCTKNSTTSNCTVSFNANGGSCSTSSLTSSRTTTYTCTGWWTATSGGTKRTTSGGKYTPTASETVYAQWSSSTGAYNAITLPTATKTGYTFVGWSTSSTATSGTTGSYTPTGNVTLYAIFSQNTYTLTVGKNGGWQGGSSSTQTFQLAYNAQRNMYRGFLESRGSGGWYFPSGSFGSNMYSNMFGSGGPTKTGALYDCAQYQVTAYSNEGTTGTITVTYPTASSQGYTGVSYIMQIARTGASGTKANGFMGPIMKANGTQSKTNTRWRHVFYAKLPSGYYFCPTANSLGTGNEVHWLSTNAGTGAWRMYAYERRLGVGGTFSDYGYGYVAVSTSASGLTNYSGSLTFWIAFSIIFNADVRWDGYVMPNGNTSIHYQWFEPVFWTYINTNGGTLASGTSAVSSHLYGASYTVSPPTRNQYTFTNWDRIYATNIFIDTLTYVSTSTSNTLSDYKIQILQEDGTFVTTVVYNSNAFSYGTWTCNLSSGYYFCTFGLNGSSADVMRTERMYLVSNVVYGYYWERVNNTAGQNITINKFVFGRYDTTTTSNYATGSNYTLYLKANWVANGIIYYNANGGWLNPAGHHANYRNDTITPLGRVKTTANDYDLAAQKGYGNTYNLTEYNNATYLNLMRLGYSVPTGEEWYNSNGTHFNQSLDYPIQTLVPTLTSSTPSSTDMYVNWQPNDYTFTLQRQDTTIASSVIENYGQIAQLPEDHKDYYTFMGWFREFSGADFVQLGRDYMYTDKIAVHLTAYRDDWSTFDNGMKLISCTEGGGWNIEGTNDWTCASGYESSVGYNVSPKLMFGLNSLTPGFHDFDIVFTGTQYQFWIDDQYAGATTWSHPIGYYVTANTCNQILVGKEASSFSSNKPDAAEPSAPAFIGYIGNVVIAHQNTRIDATAARTQWNTPVHNITLKSLFRENPYVKVHLNIGNGVVIDENNNIYHNGDIIKFYYEDNPQKTFTCYPPTAQMITSLTTRNDLTNILTNAITTGTATTASYTDGELSMDFTAVGNANAHVDIYLSMTYADIPVLRYQYLLVDNNSNNIIDNNNNNIKVTVKYIPYRHNGSTWQRCEPRGYSNGWKLGG